MILVNKPSKPTSTPSKFSIPPLDTRACYKPWIVTIKVIKANNLKAADSGLHAMKKGAGLTALSDPMVFMEVDGCVARTSVINQNLNPKWSHDEPFVFKVLVLQGSPIEFQVYDWDEDAQHDFLGKAVLKLQSLTLGTESQHVLPLTDEQGNEDQGTLTVAVTLETNFSLGDRQRELYFVKQVRNVEEDLDRDSFVKFVGQLTFLGVKHAQWLTDPNPQSMCAKLDSRLDEILETTARQTDLTSAQNQTAALQSMSLEATLEGVNAIAKNFERCMTLLLHAQRHAPNLPELITLVLNVHFSRALSELNRWCHRRCDKEAVLIGYPKKYEHLSHGKTKSPLGEVIPEIVRFLVDSNELTSEDKSMVTSLAGKPLGIFENILFRTIGDFADLDNCDFEISVKNKATVRHGVRTVSMSHMLELDHLISNEVNVRGGIRSNLNKMFLNVSKPYFDVIKKVDEKLLKLSAGGVIALVCGSKGWGGLSSDWATDCLQLMSVQIQTAKDAFAPSETLRNSTVKLVRQASDDSLSSATSSNFENNEGYCMLMLAAFQIVAHSMDALIYRFLHMFKRLRYFEDVESNKNSNSSDDLSTIEVPQEEVEIILNCLCQFMKDANRVRERMVAMFKDDRLGDKLDSLCDRLTTSLDALEMAAVSQLSYLVLKCFSATFASNRDLAIFEKVEGGDISRFENFRRKSRFIPGKSGFNILNMKRPKPISDEPSSSSKSVDKCTWPQVCNEITDILAETIPVVKQKLNENSGEDDDDDDHFVIKIKTLVSEVLALRIYFFFVKNIKKASSNMFGAFGNMLGNGKPKAKQDAEQVFLQCSEFHTSMKYLVNKLVGEKDSDDNTSCLGDGPWRSRFDWLESLSDLMAQSGIPAIASKHKDICSKFSLPVEGPMLDLSLHVCMEIRKETAKHIVPHFTAMLSSPSQLVASSNNSWGSNLASKNKSGQHSGHHGNGTSRFHNLFVVPKGVKGMIEKILRKYDAKETSAVLDLANHSGTGLGGVGNRLRTQSNHALTSNPLATVTKYAKRMSATPSTAMTVSTTTWCDEEEEEKDIEIEVEIISAINLVNLDEKSGTMSSPYVRCSLLHDYHRDNNEKYIASKRSSASSSTLASTAASGGSGSGGGTDTGCAPLITSTINASIGAADTSSSSSSSSFDALSASNQHGSHNQELFVDHFQVCTIPNNLNPVWRVGMKTDVDHNNIGTFQLPRKEHMFWGMALEIDVLTSSERLMGTVVVDLMEWDESSAKRTALTSWYPLKHKERGTVGAISLQISSQLSDASSTLMNKSYLRASVR